MVSLVVITLSSGTHLLGLMLGVTVLLVLCGVCLQCQFATCTEKKALKRQVPGYLCEASASDVWAAASFSVVLHMRSTRFADFCIHSHKIL